MSYSFVVVLNRMMSNPNYDSGTMTVDHEYHSFPAKSLRKQYNRKRINSFGKSDIVVYDVFHLCIYYYSD